jgi:WD40 repeat protein
MVSFWFGKKRNGKKTTHAGDIDTNKTASTSTKPHGAGRLHFGSLQLSSDNPKHVSGSGKQGDGKQASITIICGLHTDNDEDSGIQIVKQILQSSVFNLQVTQSLSNLATCERLILVATKDVLADKNVQTILQTAIENGTPVYVLVDTDEQGQAGLSVEDWIEHIPNQYSWLKETEAVPLLRDREYLPASIQTILNQHGDAEQSKLLNVLFDFFLSHHQKDAQGNCGIIYGLLEKLGFKVWLDMKARDLSTKGMMRGVANSANFLLFVTKDLFSRPYCLKEIREAIKWNKRIIVIYEERRQFGGLPLEQHLANVPEEFRTLRDQEKHGWLAFQNRDVFCDTMLSKLLQLCDLRAPTKEVLSLFETLPNSFRREAVPRTLAGQFLPSTRGWLFDEVKAWQSLKNPTRVFFLIGQAGVGKSVFSAELVRRGNAEVGFGNGDQGVVGFHFFKHDESRLRAVRNMFLSISAQLRKNVPGFRDAFDANTRDLSDTSEWTLLEYFLRLIAEPASAMSQTDTNQRCLVVVDALDECDAKDRDALSRILKDVWPLKTPKWLTLLVTTRPSVMAFPKTRQLAIEQGITVLNTEDVHNRDDVKLYLRQRVFRDCVHTTELEHFVDRVAEMSEGLFLYLRFLDEVISNILVCRESRMLRADDLKRFPNGLGGVYSDYFNRMHDDLGAADYAKLLGSIVAAREPVPKVLWMQACGFDVKVLGRGDAIARAKWTNLEKLCTNLVHVPSGLTGAEAGVRFVHKSMVDWLTGEADSDDDTALKSGLNDLHVGVAGGDAVLAEVCAPVFVSDEDLVVAVKEFAVKHAFYHLCRVEEFDQASQLLLDFQSLLGRLEYDTPQNIDMEYSTYFNVEFNPNEQAKADGLVVAKVMSLGFVALNSDYRQLAGQILGRLTTASVAHSVLLTKLWVDAHEYNPGVPWWRPTNAFLESAAPGGALLRILNGHTGVVFAVAFSPDGYTIASASSGATIRLWDARTGEARLGGKPIEGHTGPVRSLAFSPDGTTIVSGSMDQSVRLWDANTGEAKLAGDALRRVADVRVVAFSPDGKTIALGCWDRTIRLWDAHTGEIKVVLQGAGWDVTTIAFSADSKRVVSGSEDKCIRIWDANTGKRKLGNRKLQGHTDIVNAVAFSPDGNTIASASVDMTIRLWDAHTGESKLVLEGHSLSVSSIGFSPDSSTIVSGSWDKTIRLWDVNTGKSKWSLVGHADVVLSVSFSPDGKTVVSGSRDTTIRLWDATIGQFKIGSVPSEGHTENACAIAYSLDGQTVASGSHDSSIRLWDVCTGKPKLGGKALVGHGGVVRALAFSPDGSTLASVDDDEDDNTIHLWDLRTGEPKLASKVVKGELNEVKSIVFSPDGQMIVSGSRDGSVQLWGVNAGKPKLGGAALKHPTRVHKVAVSPDGNTIASASFRDHRICLWDANLGITKFEVKGFTGHDSRLLSMGFSADGKSFWSQDEEGVIRCWDSETGEQRVQNRMGFGGSAAEEVGVFPLHVDVFKRVVHTPDKIGGVSMTCDVHPVIFAYGANRDASGVVRCCVSLKNNKLAFLELVH